MFRVEIGSCLWNCGYAFEHKSRIKAYQLARAAVAKIPDADLRPSDADLDAAYASLAAWDRHGGKSPRMSHEPGSRRWYLNIERV